MCIIIPRAKQDQPFRARLQFATHAVTKRRVYVIDEMGLHGHLTATRVPVAGGDSVDGYWVSPQYLIERVAGLGLVEVLA